MTVWFRFGRPDMMGHPELVKQVEREELGPLISPDGLEQLQGKYVQSVRVRFTIVFIFELVLFKICLKEKRQSQSVYLFIFFTKI